MDLKVINKNGQLLTDSREVAEMVGKEHGHLLRDIRGYFKVLKINPKLDVSNFFVEASYKDSVNRSKPCFYLTKKGCELVANKMTGEKGVIFTAMYVTKFAEMEQQLINLNEPSYMIDDPIQRAERWIIEQKEKQQLKLQNAQKEQIINELQPKATYYDLVLQNKSLLSVSKIAKDYGMSARTFNKLLHELGVQFKQGDCWLLYQRYADKGYTQSKTHTIDSEKSKMHTYWTQKGRLFIYELLKSRKGILPIMERKNQQVG
ncbi:phage regulatory protein/antirepressor Ant [Priestia megaterium]|uniref:phage regulatory protein/antirepressor Ant n=1 Tax=Priestia megaterium TaxID=1404 RepID=UPI000BA7247A|nr:phage regulatory protein/antirepressor Ant [Priestia megaterium]PAK49985.1 Rha family transcriptional regulator [Priestia megaterium]